MVDAVLFDLGNVVVDWDPRRLYVQMFDDPAEADQFVATVCTMAWHGAHDRGVSMDENAAPLIAKFPEHEARIRAWKTRWLEMFNGYIPGVPALIDALSERETPLYALTNLPAEKWDETADAFPYLYAFEDVIVSGEEKLVKPDPAIYHLTLKRMDRQADRVLFIDDRAENTEAASALGFRTHTFTDAARLEAELKALGLI